MLIPLADWRGEEGGSKHLPAAAFEIDDIVSTTYQALHPTASGGKPTRTARSKALRRRKASA